MDQPTLEARLRDLRIPSIRFYPSIDSTNDEGWRWVDQFAPHAALVVADEQTAGRGRFQRRWFTPAGSGLAFSLVLRSPPFAASLVGRLSGLAALSVCTALESSYYLQAQIKWPNDVLLGGRKTAGILAESRWDGDQLVAAVVGIGINIAPESINPANLPATGLNFPATCVESAAGHPVDRLVVLQATLLEFFRWLSLLDTDSFIAEWERRLAYTGEWIELTTTNQLDPAHPINSVQTGKLVGLREDGSLILRTASGELFTARVGELQLRPVQPPDEMESNPHV
jgi:BirA family biotin operon repressor/biotin-[acetyl-CoA-carboxylase] ligase